MHPETPDDGITLNDLFAGRMDIDAMMARLRQVANDLGLPFGNRTHSYNSRRAQELGKWAEQQGRGDEFQNAVYRAYFVDGKNITKLDTLSEIAAAIGLDPAAAKQLLREQSHAKAVDIDWQRARTMEITAVPTLLYDNRRLVGFHPYESFQKLIIG